MQIPHRPPFWLLLPSVVFLVVVTIHFTDVVFNQPDLNEAPSLYLDAVLADIDSSEKLLYITIHFIRLSNQNSRTQAKRVRSTYSCAC